MLSKIVIPTKGFYISTFERLMENLVICWKYFKTTIYFYTLFYVLYVTGQESDQHYYYIFLPHSGGTMFIMKANQIVQHSTRGNRPRFLAESPSSAPSRGPRPLGPSGPLLSLSLLRAFRPLVRWRSQGHLRPSAKNAKQSCCASIRKTERERELFEIQET